MIFRELRNQLSCEARKRFSLGYTEMERSALTSLPVLGCTTIRGMPQAQRLTIEKTLQVKHKFYLHISSKRRLKLNWIDTASETIRRGVLSL